MAIILFNEVQLQDVICLMQNAMERLWMELYKLKYMCLMIKYYYTVEHVQNTIFTGNEILCLKQSHI